MPSAAHRTAFSGTVLALGLAFAFRSGLPAVAASVTLQDLGSVSGPSVASGDGVTLQGPAAVRRFRAVQSGFTKQFSESDTCGGKASVSFIDDARFEILAGRAVSCRVTIRGAGASATLATAVKFLPVTVSARSVTFAAASPLQSITAFQPGVPVAESSSCSVAQALSVAAANYGVVLLRPFANASCTLTFSGIGSPVSVPVKIAVPPPAVADIGALAGSSSFAPGPPARVTFSSADAEHALTLSEPGLENFSTGLVAGRCTNAQGQPLVETTGGGIGTSELFVYAAHNGTCRLYAQGFGGLQTAFEAVVAVPPPSAEPRALAFGGPNRIALVQFGEPGLFVSGLGIDYSSCTGVASVSSDNYHNSATVYPLANGSCKLVATGFDQQTVTVPITVSGVSRAGSVAPAAAGALRIVDLGTLQGASRFAGGTLTLSSVGAIHAFNLISSKPWNSSFPGISENCGGNLIMAGYPSRTATLTVTMQSRNNVACSVTVSDASHASATLRFVSDVPNPVAGPSLRFTSISELGRFRATQPGYQPAIQTGPGYCNGGQVTWSPPDWTGAFLVQPESNGTCTIGLGGWAGGTGIAKVGVTVAVPAPSFRSGVALLGPSTFAQATTSRPATVTLASSDSFRDVYVEQPGYDQLGVGDLTPKSCETPQGAPIARISAWGQTLNVLEFSPGHNGVCRLSVTGFGPTATELDVRVAVPPPVLSKTSLAFASLRDEATTQASEPNVLLGAFGLTTTCAKVASVSGPDVYGTIFVTPKANGTCTVTVAGFDGQTANAKVTVDAPG
jgi:hypothetical protein